MNQEIRKEIEKLFRKRQLLSSKIYDIQAKCPHEDVDVYEDSRQREHYYNHWYEGVVVTCQDCWKEMWFEEGTEEYYKYSLKTPPPEIPEAIIIEEFEQIKTSVKYEHD